MDYGLLKVNDSGRSFFPLPFRLCTMAGRWYSFQNSHVCNWACKVSSCKVQRMAGKHWALSKQWELSNADMGQVGMSGGLFLSEDQRSDGNVRFCNRARICPGPIYDHTVPSHGVCFPPYSCLDKPLRISIITHLQPQLLNLRAAGTSDRERVSRQRPLGN